MDLNKDYMREFYNGLIYGIRIRLLLPMRNSEIGDNHLGHSY